jgi:hypothetical protein
MAQPGQFSRPRSQSSSIRKSRDGNTGLPPATPAVGTFTGRTPAPATRYRRSVPISSLKKVFSVMFDRQTGRFTTGCISRPSCLGRCLANKTLFCLGASSRNDIFDLKVVPQSIKNQHLSCFCISTGILIDGRFG